MAGDVWTSLLLLEALQADGTETVCGDFGLACKVQEAPCLLRRHAVRLSQVLHHARKTARGRVQKSCGM